MRSVLIIGVIVLAGCSAENPIAGGDNVDVIGNGGAQDNTGGSAGSDIYQPSMGGSGGATGAGGDQTLYVQDAGQDAEPQIVDGNVCGSVTIQADVEVIKQPGNLLVVFDRSNSMSADWDSMPRYQAAGEALIAGLTPFQDMLTVGGIFFPSLPADPNCDPLDWVCLIASDDNNRNCEVPDITAADQISFRPGPAFIAEVPNQWFQGASGTPLGNAVVKADAALSNTTFDGAVAVLIMTDGEPNCETVTDDVISTVTKWNASGIKTYVVGLPGSDSATTLLTQIAVAGGTTDFISPDDPTALQNEISTIVTDTIKTGLKSCTINLQQTEDADPVNLHLIVVENGTEGEVLRQYAGGGWSVSTDGAVATLEGKLCDEAKSGRFESVRFDFGCVEVPVIIQ